ncbi:MFS transporter [Methylonatrum kenyense]|uniref:MFS transporter n=1 Tax=Methylonatrum kenyense TaxID=455253 RepID=UPI0020BDB41F|nr:MFS transporter [Methylonatrum kenyense]MCK8515796.1 MFS transporter [Methylonatrum kenyense]
MALIRPTDDVVERSYRILSGDDSDERSCEAIPDSACSDVPRNFLLNIGNGASTKLAEQLAGPNLVLPWLLSALGAPAAIIGFLMPAKQVGSLAPQLLVSGQIRRLARRKWAWVAAGLCQAALLLLIVVAVLVLPPVAAGLVILALFLLFAICSGVGSVAFQDVTGKTIPKGRRGRLLSARAAIGGGLTLAAGFVLHLFFGGADAIGVYLGLVVVAAALWGLAALLFLLVDETPGATDGGRNPVQELRRGLAVTRDVPGYRRYITTRGLLLSVELAMPFYALHGENVFGGEVAALGVFVITLGLASVVSSPFWGYFADQSSRTVLLLSGLFGALAGVLALIIALGPEPLQQAWIYTSVFLVLGIAEAGVRLGRKTYLVDAAPSGERPLYVAFSNTSIGLLAIAGGGLGFIAQFFGADVLVAVLVLLGLAGAMAAWRMPEAERMMAQ